MPADPVHPDQLGGQARFRADLVAYLDSLWSASWPTLVPQGAVHLLAAGTSCYRYWGEGVWTDYGAELSRRTIDILTQQGT